MADKKYQVFISSTFRDLIDERRDIARSILDLGHIPAAMEYFPAMDEEQLDYIKRIIDECDYYVIVIAGKYGSVDADGISYTEREYDYAISSNKIVLGFPIADMTKLPRNMTETDPDIVKKLDAFRTKLMGGRLIRTWQDRKDLDLAIVKGLTAAFQRFPQEGWVRTPKNSNEDLLEQIVSLKAENDELKKNSPQKSEHSQALLSDLADLNDSYTFELSVSDINKNHLNTFAITTPWTELFGVFASTIRSIKPNQDFRNFMVDNIAKHYLTIDQFDVENMWSNIMNKTYDTICAQFTAYGFVTSSNNGRFLLTSDGGRAYLAAVTVKKKR